MDTNKSNPILQTRLDNTIVQEDGGDRLATEQADDIISQEQGFD